MAQQQITINGYRPFVVEFKPNEPFYDGDGYHGGFIVYANDKHDVERFASAFVSSPSRVVEPSTDKFDSDGVPSLAGYSFPGMRGIATVLFVGSDGMMIPLNDMTNEMKRFLSAHQDEYRYENLRTLLKTKAA